MIIFFASALGLDWAFAIDVNRVQRAKTIHVNHEEMLCSFNFFGKAFIIGSKYYIIVLDLKNP
jgi:hypothetical protein